MKEFLDSTAGRTIIIAAIAAGTTVFAVPWDGAETVLRAAGGAFFGALAPLVFYLKKNADEAQDESMAGFGETVIGGVASRERQWETSPPNSITATSGVMPGKSYVDVTDFDEEYHFVKDGRHAGKYADCADCRA